MPDVRRHFTTELGHSGWHVFGFISGTADTRIP